MKKIIALMVLCLVAVQLPVVAGNDKPIRFEQLPAASQELIKKYFPSESIALVKMDNELFDKSYEVIFTNGNKLEFDRKGVWQEIDCKYTELPKEVVPVRIAAYVSQHYPQAKISKIEKESRGRFDVELSNGIDLEFDSKFNLIDIDN